MHDILWRGREERGSCLVFQNCSRYDWCLYINIYIYIWIWSLHLFLGRPMPLRPFGRYCSACFGILFVSILCTFVATFSHRENRNTCFTFHNFLSEFVPLMRKCGKYCTAGQDKDNNMTHARFVLDTRGYKHSLRICNTLCFNTTTMIAGMRLIVAIYCINIFVVFTECLSLTNVSFKV